MTTPETPAPLSPHEIVAMRALIDRQAIADQVARTARGADRFDRELYLSAFHADALVSSGSAARPAVEAYDGGRGFHDATTHATLHCLSTSNCDIDGDTAHVETYHIYTARDREETSWAAAGRYVDRFEKRDGVWAIAFRRTVIEWTGRVQDNALPLLEKVGEPATPLSASRDRDDVSYLRPLGL